MDQGEREGRETRPGGEHMAVGSRLPAKDADIVAYESSSLHVWWSQDKADGLSTWIPGSREEEGERLNHAPLLFHAPRGPPCETAVQGGKRTR